MIPLLLFLHFEKILEGNNPDELDDIKTSDLQSFEI